ncbi:MAG: thioesterase [Rhodobacterales bacterium]|nr:MAG: thioesterase [Rhodobacterales bacterium]
MPDPLNQQQRTEAMQQTFIAMPHFIALGMEFGAVGDGRAELSMAYDERFIGDPETGVIFGGAVSALMDTSCGAAVICHAQGSPVTATLDLRIDYMRSATPGQRITARAECYRITRSVAFVRAIATDHDTTRPVASATGTFTVQRPEETPA